MTRKQDNKGKHSIILPHLDFYTLKQAANELNHLYGRTDINEDYLIHLAASGKIKLSLPTFGKPIIAMPFDGELNEAMAYLFTGMSSHSLFYDLFPNQLMALTTNSDIKVNFFHKVTVYDPYHLIGNFETINGLTSYIYKYLLNHQQILDIKEKVLNQIDSGLKKQSFIENILPLNRVIFGFKKDEKCMTVVKQYDDKKEVHGETSFKEITITKNDLFIIQPELELIKNNNLRVLTLQDIPPQNDERSDIDLLKEAIVSYLKNKYGDLQNIPKTKNHKAQIRDYFKKIGINGGSDSISINGCAYNTKGNCDKAIGELEKNMTINFIEQHL